jgi:hypothetical protein
VKRVKKECTKGYGSYEKTLKSGSLDARGEKIVFKECT